MTALLLLAGCAGVGPPASPPSPAPEACQLRLYEVGDLLGRGEPSGTGEPDLEAARLAAEIGGCVLFLDFPSPGPRDPALPAPVDPAELLRRLRERTGIAVADRRGYFLQLEGPTVLCAFAPAPVLETFEAELAALRAER